MNTIRIYNAQRQDWLPLGEQKKRIREYWKNRFVRFMSTKDDRYISYAVRV